MPGESTGAKQEKSAMPTRSERSSATPDPIFASIARYLEVTARCEAIYDADEDNPRLEDEACDIRAARLELARTAPSTLAGVAAYACFLNEQSARVFEAPFFSEKIEYMAFHASLDRSLAALALTVDNSPRVRADDLQIA
jgi:hypothetical protein